MCDSRSLSSLLANKETEIPIAICSSVYNIWHLFVFCACVGTAWIMAEGAFHLHTPLLPKPLGSWHLAAGYIDFSFTGIKTLAWILLTGQVFTANKNLRLQRHKKCWNCREMTPCWGCLLITQDIILRKTFELWLRRGIQIIHEKSGFNQTILSPLRYPSFFPSAYGGQTCWDFSERFGLFSYLKWSGPSSRAAGGKLQLDARNKRDWSNQCFSDKVGGKTCEECSISISYC